MSNLSDSATQVAALIDEEHKTANPHVIMNEHGPPFYEMVHHQLREDPERRRAKLVFAAAYSGALLEFGPELYEHVVFISCGGVEAMLDCARRSTVSAQKLSVVIATIRHQLPNVQPSSGRALWVKHIDLILSDVESAKADWVATRQAWSGFHQLETLTLCYYPKEPAPLGSYCPIAAHLPPSLKLLRLRPWGEADVGDLCFQVGYT